MFSDCQWIFKTLYACSVVCGTQTTIPPTHRSYFKKQYLALFFNKNELNCSAIKRLKYGDHWKTKEFDHATIRGLFLD
jgi:hypothetical protein